MSFLFRCCQYLIGEEIMNKRKSCIGCIIVTYNRIDKLKKTLDSYAAQNFLPLYLIVVNNASTDGTKEYLDEWQKVDAGFEKIVITSHINLGGSGGYFLGEKEAISRGADWIMIADDDAYPQDDYLEGMQCYMDSHDMERVSIICGKVLQKGTCLNFHRGVWKSRWAIDFYSFSPEANYKKKEFYPDFVSYVGIVVKKSALLKVGLVNKDNFIWYDDTEHTYRLSQVGKIICIPKFTIIHDVDDTHDGLRWKTYYGFRNSLNFFRVHYPLHYPIILIILLCKTLLLPLKRRSLDEIKIRLTAIKDSMFQNMGEHTVYKPGWRPK